MLTHLGAFGLIDPTSAGITGGSAGGYTTLQAVCASDHSRAGLSLVGISDLRSLLLLLETYEFESHYLAGLVFSPGMTEAQRQIRMTERPALSHPERVEGALVLVLGSVDRGVPPNQAMEFVERARGMGMGRMSGWWCLRGRNVGLDGVVE